VDSVEEEGGWFEAEYLDAIRRHAQRITLRETDSQVLSLKPVTPQTP
jgi:hypothetical protein